MQRREALRLLASAAALPLLSREAFSMFQAVHEQLPEQPVLKSLDPHQNATVTIISELIIPQTDTPGAKAARANEFIDLILAEWYDEEEKSIFMAGLADVDSRARDLFGKDFVDCGRNRRPKFCRPWMMNWPRLEPSLSRDAGEGARPNAISFS
jgi:hypothetical protein